MNFDNYRNQMHFPSLKAVQERFLRYANLNDIPLTMAQRTEQEKAILAEAREEYDELRRLYNQEETRLKELFWNDADEELGSDDIPLAQRELLRNFAYAYGHSSGYSEIFNYYIEIVDLYRNLEEAKK